MSIEIQKAEITGRIFLKWEYTETIGGRTNNHKVSSNAPIHDDLHDAFQALVPHYVLLTEMKKKAEVAKVIDLQEMDSEALKKFKVRGVTIDDKKGVENYAIFGSKFLNTGKTVSFETPKIKRESDDSDNYYEFIDKLEEAIDNLKTEVIEYMGGKEGIIEQISMEFGEDFEPEVDEKADAKIGEFEETAA